MYVVEIERNKKVRDMNSKAVLSTDVRSLEQYRRRKELMKSQEIKINKLETDVQELRVLVQNIVNKG